ncbi:hypothetical protein [Gracilinema caldarium]|uniref:hypothetical protein n=1 Tax=Gracilinema caldarium TaxID=215591 RepID=UPI0026F19F2A|nr:hypothetical protein [Gracilinema caldarium]
MKKYSGIVLLFLLTIIYQPQSLNAELVLKPGAGFGAQDQSFAEPSLFYGGQAGFSADINLGTECLVSLSGSLDGTWWQKPSASQFNAQGGVDFSLAQDFWVYKAGLSGSFGEDQLADTGASGNIQFSLAGIRNGATVSYQIDGSVLFNVGQTLTIDYFGGISASLLWGETVVKPGFALYTSMASSGFTSYSVSPKLGLSWYPAFPIALDIVLLYERNLLEPGDSLQINTDFSMQPVPIFGVSLSHEASMSSTGYTGTVWGEFRFNLYASLCCTSWWYVSGSMDYTEFLDTNTGWKLSTGVGFRF